MIYTYLGIVCPRKKRQSFSSQIHLKLRNMSKAEDKAHECFPNEDIESKKARFGFLLGYHQAEKDLELTWEDIKLLDKIFMNEKIMSGLILGKKEYEEILKQFKDLKERK